MFVAVPAANIANSKYKTWTNDCKLEKKKMSKKIIYEAGRSFDTHHQIKI